MSVLCPTKILRPINISYTKCLNLSPKQSDEQSLPDSWLLRPPPRHRSEAVGAVAVTRCNCTSVAAASVCDSDAIVCTQPYLVTLRVE